MEKITQHKEFIDPISELTWSTEGVTQEGAVACLVYRDEDWGTYCRILRFPEGFHENVPVKDEEGCCFHEFDEVVYIATGGAINRRLGYWYKQGDIGTFPNRISHGPLEAPFGALLVEFRHYVEKMNPTADPSGKLNVTKTKEWLNPLTDLKWSTEGVTERGATSALVYHDGEVGTYCRILKLPERYNEGISEEEFKKALYVHDFDEVVYIISGGLLNRRLGYRYHPGMIGVFHAGVSHGPFEAPFGALLLQFRHYRKPGRKRESIPEIKCSCTD
ncbi:MAG: hypothetical protein ACPL6D_00640 [Thermodesulfobacteriota bacterium]